LIILVEDREPCELTKVCRKAFSWRAIKCDPKMHDVDKQGPRPAKQLEHPLLYEDKASPVFVPDLCAA